MGYGEALHYGGVRRTLTFAAAWLAAAGVAVAVAWQGVGIVTSNVIADRPAALEAGEVRELARGAEPATSAPATSAPVTLAVPGAGSTVAPTSAPASSSTSTSTRTVATTAQVPTTAQPPQEPAPVTRTYNVVGGSVALRFSAGGVTVVFATPNAGFEVDVETENVNGVRVEFESESHRSRVDGWWADGPEDEVREDPK